MKQQRAEAEAQEAERSSLTVTPAPRAACWRSSSPAPIGEAALQQWMRKTDKPHAGTDGFEDTRSRSERLGDALVDLLAQAAGPESPTPRADHDDSDDDGTTTNGPTARRGHATCDERRTQMTTTRTAAGHSRSTATRAVGAADPARESAPDDLGRRPRCYGHHHRWTGCARGLARAGRLDTGLAMSAAALRMLACDALIVPAVLGTASEVLDLGRAYRDFNRAQRRAAALRDRGCVAPGCDRPPSACHVHHMWWWIDGGPTDSGRTRPRAT